LQFLHFLNYLSITIHHTLCDYGIISTFIEYNIKQLISMKLNERIKFYRENKKLSQEFVGFQLGLNQSQYSRRESGTIKFNTDELEKISKVLEVDISELMGESTVFNHYNQSGGNFAQTIYTSEDVTKQYASIITEKDKTIELLKEQISLLQSLVSAGK
jgi:transcriptional regulator with XRE-family HTH domain